MEPTRLVKPSCINPEQREYAVPHGLRIAAVYDLNGMDQGLPVAFNHANTGERFRLAHVPHGEL